jgi:hypothetical protein
MSVLENTTSLISLELYSWYDSSLLYELRKTSKVNFHVFRRLEKLGLGGSCHSSRLNFQVLKTFFNIGLPNLQELFLGDFSLPSYCGHLLSIPLYSLRHLTILQDAVCCDNFVESWRTDILKQFTSSEIDSLLCWCPQLESLTYISAFEQKEDSEDQYIWDSYKDLFDRLQHRAHGVFQINLNRFEGEAEVWGGHLKMNWPDLNKIDVQVKDQSVIFYVK